ncbi:ribonuclease HII [Flavihumibacter stibioxidans]|uniref:Ribonuclease HII n=1 Tax=Flavihumibacter stibioxidans TaxID=1834163 RepID=A0ABR7MA81_9BACT|nr:ribonuclease HII [Flavihumibacter stibioxidans]MBC6491940.1 ribonuclease HII [Flavihumibacter stibioxidans]
MALKHTYQDQLTEAGCDEAGRGCYAGPVFAAAVILPREFHHPLLNDSKQVKEKQRYELRTYIESNALAWAVASVSEAEIDRINILQASWLAMHKAIKQLSIGPGLLLIDGNRFKAYPGIPHRCVVKGDATFMSIAAASILAKTYRDDHMKLLHEKHPQYDWKQNKGYGTAVHRNAIERFGLCEYHRKSFAISPENSAGLF